MIFEILFLTLLFLFGSSVGSFINVLVDRNENLSSIFSSTSHCAKCRRKIAFYDLIPVFSYLILRGKCRYCKGKIPKRIFVVELLTGIIFVVVGLAVPFSNIVFSVLLLLIVSCIVALFFIDLEHGILPDYLLLLLLFLSILYLIPIGVVGIGINTLVGVGLFTVFLLLFILTRGSGIGFGDVKFVFVIGLLLGVPDSLVAIYLAFVLGALVSIILIILGKKKLRGDTIPFGPFLASGILVMLLFSEKVYEYMFRFFQ